MNTENIHKYLQHKIKENHKNISIRLKYQKCMKLLCLMKLVADAWNLGGKLRPKFAAENCCGKLLRKTSAENFCGKLLWKTIAENFCRKLLRSVKSMRQTIYDKTKADVEISAPGKISAPAKLPRLWNFRAYQNSCRKVLRPLTIWARQNLQLLTSSKSGWRARVQIL
jgi:hypothetical protein